MGPVSTLVVCLKVMWQASKDDGNDGKRHSSYGFDVEIKNFSFKQLVENREKYIDFLHGAYNRGLDSNNIERIHGYATLLGSKQLKSMGQNIRRRTF